MGTHGRLQERGERRRLSEPPGPVSGATQTGEQRVWGRAVQRLLAQSLESCGRVRVVRVDGQDVLQTRDPVGCGLDDRAEPQPRFLVALVQFNDVDEDVVGPPLLARPGGLDPPLQQGFDLSSHRHPPGARGNLSGCLLTVYHESAPLVKRELLGGKSRCQAL